MGPRSILPRDADRRTWDHVVPASAGGRLQVPSCSWCNGQKGEQSLNDWLSSEALRLRSSMVRQRQPDEYDPMDRRILCQLRDEDVHRLRRALAYHGKQVPE